MTDLIRWKNVRWRGGDGYSGFVDGDMTVMIFPVTPDRDLPYAFGMFIFSEAYDPAACKTGKHKPILVTSLDHGRELANEILCDCLNVRHSADSA
jgi:hypothetical protein